MSDETDSNIVPAYACLVVGKIDLAFGHIPEAILNMQRESCKTCGYPNHHAGPLCPKCEQIETRKFQAMGEALIDHLHPRHVHMFGIGRVDPWTRAGRNLIGDG